MDHPGPPKQHAPSALESPNFRVRVFSKASASETSRSRPRLEWNNDGKTVTINNNGYNNGYIYIMGIIMSI
jgi:hypothetical protein